MPATFTVGEFSRLTHLPVRTLHHYHEVGVLTPAEVDPATGYRRYSADQVSVAHLVRRLRDVRMPPAEIRAVLTAGPAGRDDGIAAHLDRLHRELTGTATAVASLQALLTTAPAPPPVRIRTEPAQPALALTEPVSAHEIGDFCAQAYPRLFAALGTVAARPAGPGAALYEPEWFTDGGGAVTAFLPVDVAPSGPPAVTRAGRVRLTTIPGATYAVALHAGPFDELDLTYGRLGRHVLDRATGAGGPIREIYLVTPTDTTDPAGLRTDVCWPVHQ